MDVHTEPIRLVESRFLVIGVVLRHDRSVWLSPLRHHAVRGVVEERYQEHPITALRAYRVLNDTAHVFDDHGSMTIGELADALGVRSSALRHWEQEGLINPDRINQSQTRHYTARAITEARIVAALRSGGHRIPPIARVLDRLREHGVTAEVQALLDERLSDFTRRSIALLGASGGLHALLNGQRRADVGG